MTGYQTVYLMPNYEIGYSLKGGIQYNFSRQLSLELNMGYMHSSFWWYDVYDEINDDHYSYLGWHVYDQGTNEILENGSNYFTLDNLHFGLTSRYYFLPAKKFNPFALAGINLNILDSEYIDSQYDVYERLERLDEYEVGYNTSRVMLEAYPCVGFLAGGGIAYTLNENIGFFFEAGYQFIYLNWYDYIEPVQLSDLNALKLHLGVRFSFLKSKQL